MSVTKVPNELLSDPHIGVGIVDNATSTALTISSTGIVEMSKVGLGTSNPLSILHLGSGTNSLEQLTIAAATGGECRIKTVSSISPITFVQGNSGERMRITSTGNVEMGGNLDVSGSLQVDSGTSSDIIIEKNNTGGASLRFHNEGLQKSYIQLDASEDMIHYGASGVNQIVYAGGAERMRIDTAGRVTMPYQPAFRARAATVSAINPSSSSYVIPFPTIVSNIGGHFSTTSNAFTAPVAGTYMFSASTRIDGMTSGYGYLNFEVNGTTAGRFLSSNTGTYLMYTLAGTITLNANDTVRVSFRTSSDSNVNLDVDSWFSGHLVG